MRKKQMRGFSLLEIMIATTLFFIVMAASLASFSRFNKLNLKLEKDLTSDTSFTGFNQAFVSELLKAESSLYFLNIPIPTVCSDAATNPCVRHLNSKNVFESTTALSSTASSIQFYRDEMGLLKDFPAYSENSSSRLLANKPLPLKPQILNDKYYSTWPLPTQQVGVNSIPNKSFVMLNKRDDTSLYFDFPVDFATSSPSGGAFTNYVMAKSSVPKISTDLFLNNIIVLYNAFETRHYFVRKLSNIIPCSSSTKCAEYLKLNYPKLDPKNYKSDNDYLIKIDELTYDEMIDYVPALNVSSSSTEGVKYWDPSKKSMYIFPTSIISVRDSAPPPTSGLGSFWPLPNPYSFIHFSQSQGNGSVKIIGIPVKMYAYYIKAKDNNTQSVVRREYFTNKTIEMLRELPKDAKVFFTRRLGTADMSVFTNANVKELEATPAASNQDSGTSNAPGQMKKIVLKLVDTFSPISNGTIRNNLPRPPAQALKKFYPSQRGQTTIEGTLLCGDYDVVNFSTAHPKFDIMRQINSPLNRYWLDGSPSVPAKLGTTFGFWIIDSKSNNLYKWFPVSSGEITFAPPPAISSTVQITSLNTTDGTGDQILTTAAANYVASLGSIKTFKMPAASSAVTANLYVGAQLCNLTQLNSSAGAIPAPSLVKIGAEIQNAIEQTIPNEIDDLFSNGHGDPNDFKNFKKRIYNFTHKPAYDFKKFNFSPSATSINFAIGNGPNVVSGQPLDKLASDVLEIDYPDSCVPTPTPVPTEAPTTTPTAAPSGEPGPFATGAPATAAPTSAPTAAPVPSATPACKPIGMTNSIPPSIIYDCSTPKPKKGVPTPITSLPKFLIPSVVEMVKPFLIKPFYTEAFAQGGGGFGGGGGGGGGGWMKACTLPQFKTAMNSNPTLTTVRNLINKLKSVQDCKDVDPSIADPIFGYFWEYMPYQQTCRSLLSTIPKWNGTLEDALNDIQNPPDAMNHWEFEDAKENIAKFLKLGAYANEMQKTFQNNYKTQLESRNTCVPNSATTPNFIDKVMGSIVAGKRAIDENPLTLTTKHPEPSFAISTYSSYYGAAGNQLTIYQFDDNNKPPFLQFSQGGVYNTTYTSYMSKMGVKFSFNIRAILCCDGSYYSCFC